MEIWSLAQTELNKSPENADISNLTFKVLTSNLTTPMIRVSKNGEIESKNVDSLVVRDTIKLNKLKKKFKSENTPIEISYNNEVIETLYYGNSDVLNKKFIRCFNLNNFIIYIINLLLLITPTTNPLSCLST